MSMNTYPLNESCAFVITPELACAMLLADSIKNGIEVEFIPAAVKAAIDAGRTCWDVSNDKDFLDELDQTGWRSVSDANDMLDSVDFDGKVYCSEFQGSAEPDIEHGFGNHAPGGISFEDDYILIITPEKAPGLFTKAYGSPDELASEYAARLSDWFPEGFPIKNYIFNISGTYFC